MFLLESRIRRTTWSQLCRAIWARGFKVASASGFRYIMHTHVCVFLPSSRINIQRTPQNSVWHSIGDLSPLSDIFLYVEVSCVHQYIWGSKSYLRAVICVPWGQQKGWDVTRAPDIITDTYVRRGWTPFYPALLGHLSWMLCLSPSLPLMHSVLILCNTWGCQFN